MKMKDAATMGLKLLAIYAFFQFLAVLPAALGMLQMASSFSDSVVADNSVTKQYTLMASGYLGGAIVYLVLSVSVFLGANRLARFFVAEQEDSGVMASALPEGILSVAFQCFGVYALITWAPNLIQTIARCTIYGTWSDPQVPFMRRFYDSWSTVVSPSVGVAIGLLLIFKAKGLLRLLSLVRPMSPERIALEEGNEPAK
jgi:hypothetical protein